MIGSSFINNQTAIEVLPYRNFHPVYGYEMNYSAKIYNSEFITERELLDGVPFYEFVKMTQVNGIDFLGCDFINERPDSVDYADRGKGIYSLGAQFYVDDYCLDPSISPCVDLKSCSFQGLEYGIKNLEDGLEYTCKVNDAEFLNNHSGVYLSVCDYATITRNTFTKKR